MRRHALRPVVIALALTAIGGIAASPGNAGTAVPAAAQSVALGRTTLGGADPSVIRVGNLYVAAKSVNGGIAVRTATTLEGIAGAPRRQVWTDTGNLGEVWAPEIVYHNGRYRIYAWSNRYWYTGTAVWWSKTTYRRANVPGANTDVGYSLKFFE